MRASTGKLLGLSMVSILATGMAITSETASAGAFVFAGEANGLDIITHPFGYSGVGGTIYVEVCIDSAAADARAMAQPILNIVKEINFFEASSPNLFFGADNNVPADAVDFESLTLHELGHCIGLAHPNLATESNLPADQRDFTKATVGTDAAYGLDSGVDGLKGSADDQRGDDVNLHWFEAGVNNPFQTPASAPGAGTYTRDLAQLPTDDSFVANADRTVGNSLGYPDTEAVMQQGQFFDEDQRRLTADDIATLQLGMAGVDETPGTADDYEIRMIYGGQRTSRGNCEIMIQSSTSGFGVCFTSGAFIGGTNHVQLINPVYEYNSDFNFYFNQLARLGCSAADDALAFAAIVHADTQFHEACTQVDYRNGYEVAASGEVTAVAPVVSFGPGVSVSGTMRVIIATP